MQRAASALRDLAGSSLPWLSRLARCRALLVVAALAATVLGFWALVPVVQFDDPLSTVVLDRDGRLLGATIAADGQWRFGVAEQVPPKFATAITRFEDRRFSWHPGVDPLAMGRALALNLRRGRVVSGGSTLTMQVVRLARKGQHRTYVEKLIEAVLALRLELSLSKPQILGLYAAYAPFGGNAVGVDAAAWRYFGHDARHLSWAETAMLAVLPNAPALIHPGRHRDLLLAKRNRLLDSLFDAGEIDAVTRDLAKQEPLPPAPRPLPMLAPHLLARVQQDPDLRRGWRTGDASPWVRTTLAHDVQARALGVLARHGQTLATNDVHNAAALIVEVDTGRVVAYLGNLSNFDAPEHGAFVDVIPAPRSTGSILKPLLFAGMLEAGEVLPGQLIPDVPTRLGAFHPENFSRTHSGAVPAEMALARSLNVPAVRMLREYGVDRFCLLLKSVGLTTLFRPAHHYGLALILGGAEGSLWDITGAYAGLARVVNGYHAGKRSIFRAPTFLLADEKVSGRAGRAHPRLSAAACYLTLQAMLEVERPGEEAAWRSFGSSRKIAWKTGTSYGYRDAWAVGVTPRYAVGVWVGNADGEGRPGLTGYSAAAPILFELFDLLPGSPWFAEPEADLFEIQVCRESGMRRGPHCREARTAVVPKAGLSASPCSHCRLVHLDPTGAWQVHGDCQPVAAIRSEPWFVLPPTLEAFYRRQHAGYRVLPPYRADCRAAAGSSQSGSLACVYPKQGAQVFVPVEMDGETGRVVFEAAHRAPEQRLFWHLDDTYLGETRDIHEMALAPSPGPHRLTLVDEGGETVSRTFTVLARAVDGM